LSQLSKTKLLILIFLLVSANIAFADNNFKVLATQCNGTLLEISPDSSYKKLGKVAPVGAAQCSYVQENIYFSINSSSIDLIDIKTFEKMKSFNLKGEIDNNQRLWKIGYVDDTSILFSTYNYEMDKPINKQRKNNFIYEFNFKNNQLSKLPITDCKNTTFSKINNKIYYTGQNAEIYEFSNGVSKKVGARGKGVSISPQGDKLAYITFGLVMERVEILDLKSGKTKTVIRRGLFEPIISWSDDGSLIAVKTDSDLFKQPLFVINVSNKKILHKFKNTSACNWKFITN
jgi:hypothetical protein